MRRCVCPWFCAVLFDFQSCCGIHLIYNERSTIWSMIWTINNLNAPTLQILIDLYSDHFNFTKHICICLLKNLSMPQLRYSCKAHDGLNFLHYLPNGILDCVVYWLDNPKLNLKNISWRLMFSCLIILHYINHWDFRVTKKQENGSCLHIFVIHNSYILKCFSND